MPIQNKKNNSLECEAKPKLYKVEIVSIRIEYNKNLIPMRQITKPFDFFDRSSQIERNIVNWYLTKIKTDLVDEKRNSLFSLPHWNIQINNPDLFNFMDKSYTSIDLIFGQEKTYWKFTGEGETSEELEIVEGETELNIGTCSCCIDTLYPRIIKDLQNQFKKS